MRASFLRGSSEFAVEEDDVLVRLYESGAEALEDVRDARGDAREDRVEGGAVRGQEGGDGVEGGIVALEKATLAEEVAPEFGRERAQLARLAGDPRRATRDPRREPRIRVGRGAERVQRVERRGEVRAKLRVLRKRRVVRRGRGGRVRAPRLGDARARRVVRTGNGRVVRRGGCGHRLDEGGAAALGVARRVLRDGDAGDGEQRRDEERRGEGGPAAGHARRASRCGPDGGGVHEFHFGHPRDTATWRNWFQPKDRRFASEQTGARIRTTDDETSSHTRDETRTRRKSRSSTDCVAAGVA